MKIGSGHAVLVVQCAAQMMPYLSRNAPYPLPYDDEQRDMLAREAVLMALAIVDQVNTYVNQPWNI